MSSNPQISIIVPVYNGAEHISRTLNSLSGQTFSEIEIIVLDDASVDNTLQILQRYAAADKRIRVISDSTNQGPGKRRIREYLWQRENILCWLMVMIGWSRIPVHG